MTVVKAFENGSLPVDPAPGVLQLIHHCEVAFLSVIWFNGDCALPVPTGQSARVERDCEAMFLGSTYLRSDYYLFAPSLPRDRAGLAQPCTMIRDIVRSEEHTSELQSLMRISYAVFCLKKKQETHENS